MESALPVWSVELMSLISSDRCYCLNPYCQQPENPWTAQSCQNCGAMLQLQGRYRAIQLIGAGGFGRTFLAVDESKPALSKCVIKQFFPQQVSQQAKAAELFRQEATRLEQIGSHGQIPQFLAYCEQEGCQYLVQEFIAGQNLAQELAKNGPFDEVKIRQLLNDILPVLWFVHNLQMIHRDIKPENIIRRHKDGQFVLVDFGAAKWASETALAKTGTMIGSAAYTAPEQTKGKATFASDIYSFGVTCIYLMTQISPFDLFDASENRWVWRHYLSKPIHPHLGRVLDKMLQSATKQRYQSATEVLNDLNSPRSILTKSKYKVMAGGAVLLLGMVGFTLVNSLFRSPVPTAYREFQQERLEMGLPAEEFGGLFANINGQQETFPLQHTDVNAKVSGNVARVEVKQQFTNPYQEPLEAIYKFPLPDEAAVDDMEIQIGNRVIRGVIKKREEAKQIYEQAKQEGKTAGLLEQERDNIFTQSLANIKPGETIDVTIRYTESLKFEGGDYEFVFPMVVGPRYIPTVQKQEQPGTDIAVNPPILPSETRSGNEVSMAVEIEAGVPISVVESPSHPISLQRSGSEVEVRLTQQEIIPNKDFILRYKVTGAETQTTVLTQSDQRGGHFATYLIPAVKYDPKEIVPKDVVFLIDTSGSQSGFPMNQSKELMRQFINGLNPEDTFTIVDFSDTTSQLSSEPLPNTVANRSKAIAYVNRLNATGGTELMNGIDKVLSFPPAPTGRLRSIVLLTDGLIGNDFDIIAQVKKGLKPGNRLYTFGVGPSTNRFLIDRLAELGRGTAEVVPPDEPAQKVAEEFFREINSPVLTNVEVSWIGSGEKPEIYPKQAPDLFDRQPLVLLGRKTDRNSGKLKITGTAAGGQRYTQVLDVNFNQISGNSGIAQLWGRARIKELMNQMYGNETPQLEKAVTETALTYRLMSQFTSFVAVTEEVRVDPKGQRRTVPVPVELPEGMNQEQALNSPNANANIPEPKYSFAVLAMAMLLIWKRCRLLKKIAK
jgi:Ca-activated chloride channel family protein